MLKSPHFTPTHISLFKDKLLQKLSALVAEERISTNKAKENSSTELIEHEENILMDVIVRKLSKIGIHF